MFKQRNLKSGGKNLANLINELGLEQEGMKGCFGMIISKGSLKLFC